MDPGTPAAGRYRGATKRLTVQGDAMRYILIRDDATLEDIEQALILVRAKQRKACIASTRDEIGEDINELLEMRARICTPPVFS